MNKILSTLSSIPSRQQKPRTVGRNIVYDYGISLKELESLFIYAEHIDALEIGYGPAFLANDLKDRVNLCISHNVTPFFSGFVFEVFVVRNKFEQYLACCNEIGIKTFQVSDECAVFSHTEKCDYIEKLAKHGEVYSKVGSLDVGHIIPPYKWIELMKSEIDSGATYVFAEGGEAGNRGIYRGSAEPREGLVQEILTQIPLEKIIWDAPHTLQQAYFIEFLGNTCNCSKLRPELLLSFESMRLGVNPHTFDLFIENK